MRILVVAAHPDDEVLGAGGAIARHRRRGDRVSILILGEGLGARFSTRQVALAATKGRGFVRLHQEMIRAHRLLGVTQTFHRQFPDNRFDSVDLLDLVKAVEEVTRQVTPRIVYTHHTEDLNVDHRLTCEAVLTACRPLAGETVKEILSFEVLSSTEWAPPRADRAFIPNVFLDISAVLDRKLNAMACYRSELRQPPHPRSLKAIRHQATLWGAKVGVDAAEAFELIRSVR
ncbi:MAG TPA: GlcNAc-PI de-N-acetylase [Candidatus Omnitrophica bacterium]|nr:GlcNAc-PI de-N-acetylase [Candidatus Omnitrophota bacterium]